MVNIENLKKGKKSGTKKETNNFRQFETIRSFGRNIYNREITLDNPKEDQSDFLTEIANFLKNTKPKIFEKGSKKRYS